MNKKVKTESYYEVQGADARNEVLRWAVVGTDRYTSFEQAEAVYNRKVKKNHNWKYRIVKVNVRITSESIVVLGGEGDE